jgi:hypothetical protein
LEWVISFETTVTLPFCEQLYLSQNQVWDVYTQQNDSIQKSEGKQKWPFAVKGHWIPAEFFLLN